MSDTKAIKQLTRDTRFEIISKALDDPEWTAKKAAEVLHLTVRQVFRLKAKVQAQGRAGLIHGNTGRQPVTTLPDRLHQRVVDLYGRKFKSLSVGYSHYTDLLAQNFRIDVNRETVRQWLLNAGLGRKTRRRIIHRLKRERRCRMGQMLFLDGSPHHWFGPEEPRVTLILATDDATGAPLYGCFKPHETRNGCFEVLYYVMQQWGIPETLYLDRGSVFTTTRYGGLHYHQVGGDPTAFQLAMERLAVQIIFAHTPQARGRGERMNGSFQGRLVAELRWHKIAGLAAADRYLNKTFIPQYVQRFAVEPRDPKPAFRPVPEGLDLRRVLCKTSSIRVNSDNTIRVNGRTYQLYPSSSVRLYGQSVSVEEWFDESIHVYDGQLGEIQQRLIPVREIYRLRNNAARKRHYDIIKLP